ncbi:Ger(x)C family spore germination protein [Ectobacillus sp. sgz5001026]|uniref:Ger(x)C family spore germination protein n=1 Tax=Ectobacillus sp. sgz5001026 TaxID=3242473 RepID=UPI0036D40E7C
MKSFLSLKMMKKYSALLFFSASLLLTGCWDRQEVNDTALVLATAIDKDKNEEIKLTVQVLNPKKVSGGQQGSGAGGTSNVLMRSATGKNMADAMANLQAKFTRVLFLGHCKAYIFGEAFAKDGINQQIDFLLRQSQPRERANLFVSDGLAADILKSKTTLELFEGERLRKLSALHTGADITVKDFQQMIIGDSEAAILPIIQTVTSKNGKMRETVDYITGTAIFKKGKMVGRIDDKVTRGLLWLRNETEVSAISVAIKEGEIMSIDPIRVTTKILPTIKNGKWKILVKIISEASVVQNGTHLDIMSADITKRIEKELEQVIKQRIVQTLSQVKTEMHIDAFGFADAFHRKYPKEWEKVKDHWDEILPRVDVKMDIRTYVRRPGMSTIPAGLKENEVKTE